MNNAISWGSMILALFLIGCKSEGVFEGNGDSSGGPSILPPPPQIISMDVLYDGGVLVPKVECSTCEKDLYQYQWTVDGRVVGSESTYALTDYDMRLDITGEDAFGQIATAYTVYRVSSVAYHIESSRSGAFSALYTDGSVVTWGKGSYGGVPYYNDPETDNRVDITLSGIKTVFSADYAFAALKEDDTVVTWGNAQGGGAPYYYDHTDKRVSVQEALSSGSGVKDIFSTIYAFAALKEDGTVVTWGDGRYGGAPYYYYDDSETSNRVDVTLSGIKTVFSTNYAFAALKEDGTVVTWGDRSNGGAPYYADPETNNLVDVTLSGIKTIFSTNYAFAALKEDGTVVTWGYGRHGGAPYYADPETNNLVDVTLSGIKSVFSSPLAFAAIKKDGSVVTWGDGSRGGAPYREEIGIFSIPPVVIAVVETSL